MNALVKEEKSLSKQIKALSERTIPKSEAEDLEYGIGWLKVSDFGHYTDSIASQPIFVDGRAWTLIYDLVPKPQAETQRATHISVHLQMASIEEQMRLDLPSRTDFMIELIHPTNLSKKYNQEGQSDFRGGKVRGFERFYGIRNIRNNGFIYEDGSIVFKFYIRKSNLVKQLAEVRQERDQLKGAN